ncbi:hypothetical protein ABEB36_004647 [Hypothenemus hampei]|uniref:Uncharacterized protein n=1 Tax=Hypothenemus hampei TaxID=57062 RepID=A0ABD1F413_HYPHA
MSDSKNLSSGVSAPPKAEGKSTSQRVGNPTIPGVTAEPKIGVATEDPKGKNIKIISVVSKGEKDLPKSKQETTSIATTSIPQKGSLQIPSRTRNFSLGKIEAEENLKWKLLDTSFGQLEKREIYKRKECTEIYVIGEAIERIQHLSRELDKNTEKTRRGRLPRQYRRPSREDQPKECRECKVADRLNAKLEVKVSDLQKENRALKEEIWIMRNKIPKEVPATTNAEIDQIKDYEDLEPLLDRKWPSEVRQFTENLENLPVDDMSWDLAVLEDEKKPGIHYEAEGTKAKVP